MIGLFFAIIVFFRAVRNSLKDPRFKGTATLLLLLIISSSIFYSLVEKWSFLDSIYFSVNTLATVGFGDFTPRTSAGKIFTIFYIIIGIGIFAVFISSIGEKITERRAKLIEKRKK